MTTRTPYAALAAACALMLLACAPTLDWRETRAEGSAVQLLFPCRPTRVERSVKLDGAPVKLALSSCVAGGQTWGLSLADVGDPARVDAHLAALSAVASGNLGAPSAAVEAQVVPGATPQPRGGRLRLQGRLPDGKLVRMQALLFTRGTVVFQASVVGETLSDEAVETFFSSLRFDGR